MVAAAQQVGYLLSAEVDQQRDGVCCPGLPHCCLASQGSIEPLNVSPEALQAAGLRIAGALALPKIECVVACSMAISLDALGSAADKSFHLSPTRRCNGQLARIVLEDVCRGAEGHGCG